MFGIYKRGAGRADLAGSPRPGPSLFDLQFGSHPSFPAGISCCPMANPHRRQASESGGIGQRPNRLIRPHSTMLFRIHTFVMPAY